MKLLLAVLLLAAVTGCGGSDSEEADTGSPASSSEAGGAGGEDYSPMDDCGMGCCCCCSGMDCCGMDCCSMECCTMDCCTMDCCTMDCCTMDCCTMEGMDCCTMDCCTMEDMECCTMEDMDCCTMDGMDCCCTMDEGMGCGDMGGDGSGAPKFEEGTPEAVLYQFVTQLAEGNLEGLDALIGRRATGSLRSLREGNLTEEQAAEMKDALSKVRVSASRSIPGGKLVALEHADGRMIQFRLAPEGGALLIQEMNVSAPSIRRLRQQREQRNQY